jgi:bifunctional DNase/RNase
VQVQQIDVVGVRIEIPTNSPVLVLREQDNSRRVVTLYIGGPEASAIHTALEGIQAPRPLTHDLCINVVEALGGRIDRIVLTEIKEQTYFAEIHVVHAGDTVQVSSRPSDAVAIALRVGCPIFIEEALLDEVGKVVVESGEVSDEGEETAIIDEFKDFIDNVNPEDFSD